VSIRNNPLPVQWFRLARFALHVVQGLLTAALVFPAIKVEQREQLKQRWSVQLLEILNVIVRVSGALPPEKVRGALFVANHISWLDIYALNTVKPMRFIAKSEVRAWPLVGWLAEKTGTLFIERSRRHDTGRVATIATQALRSGSCLCFFPEGTTTDGTTLLPFKTSLLQPAIDAGVQIWPLSIRYPLADGGINTAIAYWGDVTMWQSVKEILKQQRILVELHFCTPLPAAGQVRRALADEARQAIAALLNLPAPAVPETPACLPDAVQ
jgi:1-acyl-sn-glycerol-3-phosphate acyltransferase